MSYFLRTLRSREEKIGDLGIKREEIIGGVANSVFPHDF